MADAYDNQSKAGEMLAGLHSSFMTCAQSWGELADKGDGHTLSPTQVQTIAEYFTRLATEVASIAVLMGFGLVPVAPLAPPAKPKPQPKAKARLAVIQGGKT